jgi:DHA2 family multidrug resistance protein
MTELASSQETRFHHSPWIILINVLVSTFFSILSVVVTMIADDCVQGELALSQSKTVWVTTLYLLGLNTTVPVAAWFSNRFGPLKVYTCGQLFFTIGTLGVAFSNSFFLLAFSRFIEGIGAGLIFPVGLSLLIRKFPKNQLPLVLSLYIGAAFGLGLGFGPPLAGYISQFHSWRILFFLMVPFNIAAAFHTWVMRKEAEPQASHPFDTWGFFTFTLFIAALLIALTLGPLPSTDQGWWTPYIVGCFLLAAFSLIAFLFIESKHPNPVIPLSLFKDPVFAISTFTMFLLGMSIFASLAVTADYMRSALHYERYTVGKIGSTYGLSFAFFSIVANVLLKWKIPIPLVTFLGLTLLVVSYFLNNILDWNTGPSQIFWILLLRGMGVGLSLGPTTIQALAEVPRELGNSAATLLTFFRQVGGTYGTTIIAIFTIKRSIFHTARFGEQGSDQLPGFKTIFHNIYNRYFHQVSDLGKESAAQAKATILANIETQSFIAAQSDALRVFGYATIAVGSLLAFTTLYRYFKKRSISNSNSSVP